MPSRAILQQRAQLSALVCEIKEGRRPLNLWSFLKVLLCHHVEQELAAGEESGRRMAHYGTQIGALTSVLEQLGRRQNARLPTALKGLVTLESLRQSVREHLAHVRAANRANKKSNPDYAPIQPTWRLLAEPLLAQAWRERGQMLGIEASGTPWEHFVGVVIGNCSTTSIDESFVREWIVRKKGYSETRPGAAELSQLNRDERLSQDLLAEMRTEFPGQAEEWFGSVSPESRTPSARAHIGGRATDRRGKRGRKALATSEERRRSGIIDEWEKHRDGKHGRKKDFCANRKPQIKVKELNRILAWQRTRSNRAVD